MSPPKPKNRPHNHKTGNHLRLLINCQCISNKKHHIDILVETTTPDMIIGTETWLHSDIPSSEFIDPNLGLNVYRNDRASDTHGGVIIAVKTNIEVTDIKKSKNVELIFGAQFSCQRVTKMVIAAYYRPPNRTDEAYLTETYNELIDLKQKHKKSIDLYTFWRF